MIKEAITVMIIGATPVVAQSIDASLSEEDKATLFVEIGGSTKYASEGIEFSKNPTLEGGYGAETKHLSFGLYINYSPKDNIMNEGEFNIEYNNEFFNKFLITLGVSHTSYPSDPEINNGLDFYHNVEYKLYEKGNTKFGPQLFMMTDIINNGKYLKFSLDGQMPISEEVILNLGLGGAYNDKYFREEKGFSHAETRLELEFPLLENLTGNVNATRVDNYRNTRKSYTVGNLNLRYEF